MSRRRKPFRGVRLPRCRFNCWIEENFRNNMRLSPTRGTKLFSGLLEFAEKYQVTSAHFTAVGASNGATLGWFDPQRKMYKKIAIDGSTK
jgi:hypothetical protein